MKAGPKRRVAASLATLATAVAGIAVAAPGAAAAAGHGVPEAAAVRAVAAQEGISREQAREHLATQYDAGDVVGELERALGGGYAGVWFDRTTGRYSVAAAPDTDRAALRELLAGDGLGDADVVEVASTWAELEAAQASWTDRVTSLIRGERAFTRIDPVGNRVVVEVSEELPVAQSERLAADARRAAVEVDVRTVPASTLNVELDACTAQSFCDAPVRGGIRIESARYADGTYWSCSSAFPARDVAGNRYLLTAGHCLLGDALVSTQPWSTKSSGGGLIQLGASAGAHYGHGTGDVGMVPVSAGVATTPAVHMRGSNEAHPIKATAGRSYIGQTLCGSGATSGLRCGQVERVNVTFIEEDGRLTSPFDGVTTPGACSDGGDSGSPWMAGNSGSGIHSGSARGCVFGETSWFTSLATAESVLGVSTERARRVATSFNGDAAADLITGSGAGWYYAVATSTGSALGGPGTQQWLQGWDGNPEFGDIGDFNGDGKTDLVIRNAAAGTFSVALSDGSRLGAPGTGNWFSAWRARPHWLDFGDFDGDGRDDLITGDGDNARYAVATSTGHSFGGPGTQFWLQGWDGAPEFGEVGDFNGDGKDDLVIRNDGDGTFAVALSDGTSLRAPGSGTWFSSWTGRPDWFRVGDFNGDGKDDLIFGVDALSGYAVALSDGSSFGAPGTQFWLFGWDPSPEWGGIADFNGDGKDDLIVRDHRSGTFAVAVSNGTELGAPGTGTWLSTWTGTPDWLAFG